MIAAPGDGWVRLSPRKLLLDPVKTIGQAIVPVVITLVGVSRSDTSHWLWIFPLVVVGPLLFGALPWLTTHDRLTVVRWEAAVKLKTMFPDWVTPSTISETVVEVVETNAGHCTSAVSVTRSSEVFDTVTS